MSWSDGTPTASSANNFNGLYDPGIGNGFSFTVPASATARTVKVHVGGWNSGGILTAHLSDNSGSDFTDITPTVGIQYDRNYTLTYQSAGSGTLVVTWKMNSGSGNVTLNGVALLSGSGGSTPGPPASVQATAGASQSATVSTAYSTLMKATVLDALSNPVSGIQVNFAAPSSGASGTFAGGSNSGLTLSVTTDVNGVAAATAFTANSQAGGFIVTATVTGLTPANFNLTNNAVVTSSAGFLVGTSDSLTSNVNLTSEGTGDWVHWGDASLTRKASGGGQIAIGGAIGSPLSYNNDARPMSWSDGTPTASSTNNLNGLYFNGTGNGYSFTVPANATIRLLKVHVGGWNSGGMLTAHLSDNSAQDFVDISPTVAGSYDRNYTLTYQSGGSGTLTVTWKMNSGGGNVTLSAATLAGGSAGPPANVQATAGTPQAVEIGTSYPVLLQATVRDAVGTPVSNVQVTFAAPPSGASGTFAGGSNGGLMLSVTTDGSGVATATAFTANSQGGGFTVTATVNGLTPANFSMTNNPGNLTGSVDTSTTAVNLTAAGTVDWLHVGDASLNRKAGVTPQLAFTMIPVEPPVAYANDLRQMSWSDGTPTSSSSNNQDGLYPWHFHIVGSGFSITAPADTTDRTLVVYVGGWETQGGLLAQLSDGSAVPFVDQGPFISTQYDRTYTLHYRAGSAGQTLTVTWTMVTGNGNVNFNAAALQ
jgi:hypothetical protein